MMQGSIFLFGEAEKGDFCTPLFVRSLPELVDTFGHPPEDSLGIFYAVQALLYDRALIFYRVKEEGFSLFDYLRGLKILEQLLPAEGLAAICLPGVGDETIIDATSNVCFQRKTFLVLTERDFYDFLTH